MNETERKQLDEFAFAHNGILYFGKFCNGGGNNTTPIPGGVRVRYIMPSIRGLREPVYRTEYYAKGASVTAYPPLPAITDNRLEFDGYTHTLQELENLQNDIDVGVMLKTVDGKTYADFTLTQVTGLSPTIYFQISGTATFRVNWGDGSYDDYSASATPSHTYPDYGNYTLTVERISGDGSFELGGGSNTTVFFGGSVANYQQALTGIYIGSFTNISNSAFNSCRSLSSVVIPNSVTSIADSTFSGCYSLSSVVIPNSVTSIGSFVFDNCRSLSSVVIPNSITSIAVGTFSGCYSLSSVVIPNSVTSIANNTFTSCYTLSSVVIPNSVTSIGSYVFDNCRSLSSVVIPNSVTSIAGGTFSGCYCLSSVVIPNSVTSIADGTFNSCYCLSSVVIPNSVTNIGSYAFDSCYNLKSYTFLAEIPPSISTNVFSGITSISKIYVPDASVESYKSATNWTAYANRIYPLSQKPQE